MTIGGFGGAGYVLLSGFGGIYEFGKITPGKYGELPFVVCRARLAQVEVASKYCSYSVPKYSAECLKNI